MEHYQFIGQELLREKLENEGMVIFPPMDVHESILLLKRLGLKVSVTILDPWYNKGIGGTREDYIEFITSILNSAKDITNHLYLWGFPEIVARFVDKIPPPLQLFAWLTWYFKNTPSVIKGWRSSQQACLHLTTPEAQVYPENFFNEEQKRRYAHKKMRFIPGPLSVIEEPLLVGFVGKNEQTGHPAQKPVKVYERLLLMTTQIGDIIFDPMCGSGTTGEASKNLGVKAILSDSSEEYIQICEKRLGVQRLNLEDPSSFTEKVMILDSDRKPLTREPAKRQLALL